MKTQSSKTVLFAALFVVCMASFSCNRGVGCPSNFSMEKVVTKVVQQVVKADLIKALLR